MPDEQLNLHLNLDTNCRDSFEKAERFLVDHDDSFRLKWFVVSLHHAVHLAMLLALKGSAGQGIWETDSKRLSLKKKLRVTIEKWGDTLVDIFSDKNKLLTFLDAYELIKDPQRMKRYIHSRHFQATPDHDDAMKFINDKLRNAFVHPRPISFSYGEGYILDQISPVLDVAFFLLKESGNCNFYDGNQTTINLIEGMRTQIGLRLSKLKTEGDQMGQVSVYEIKTFESD